MLIYATIIGEKVGVIMDKYLNQFNDESKIIEYLQTEDLIHREPFIFPNRNNKQLKMKEILDCIINKNIFNDNWIDNSKNTNNPPDYYSNSLRLMMDVMRFNDFEVVENDKVKNPQLQHESKSFKELKEKGIMDMFPNANLFVNLNTGVPSSYENYIKSFKRVIAKHDDSFAEYKKNHPNFKLVYLLFDESEYIYYENYEEDLMGLNRLRENVNIHYHYLDINFISVIKKSKADYVIWFAPYKQNAKWGDFLEQISIFDVKNMDIAKGKIFRNLK